ncbi:UMP-CMP kinase 2, mitochondrial [Struthio camelus]|uniref:UMP-CMP kinase 2, mitochondrial n=1 Tax=Struthio camelus TaxID=8801 RepID=UPI0036040F72
MRRRGALPAPPRYAVELPGSQLVRLALVPPGAAAARGPPRCFPPPPARCYSLCLPLAGGGVRAARLHRRLQQHLGQGPLARCRVLPLLAYGPRRRPRKGFLLQDPRGAPETARCLAELLRAQAAARPPLAVYEADERGALRQRLWALAAGGGRRLPRLVAAAAPPPALHPAVAALRGGALPPSAPAARARLRQCALVVPEASAVLEILEKCPQHPKKGDFPVIVIEGLDGTGKTTVTESVKDALNAVLLRSPPACISQWRTTFDNEPTLIRRTFYAAGNYILASEIAKASTQSPVIIDRYWHSTVAYTIAAEINGKVEDLPPAHHEVYQWPEDLLKPDLVLLLTLSPEERIRRLQGRGLEKTKEEAELEANSLFREKVEESYRRMVNPACQEVDASPSKEEVLKTVLQLIKKHCAL